MIIILETEPQNRDRFLAVAIFWNYGHLTIPAKLHCPKGGRINDSLLHVITNKQTDTQKDCCNPRRATAPRFN